MEKNNKITIIAFTFAGGSKYSYQKLSQKLPQFVVIEYPGRGLRIGEDLIDDIDLLVENLMPKVLHEISLSNEYVIYGHSLGGLVGYLICHKLQELGIKKPLKLIVSGRKAPSIGRKEKIAHLSNNLFWEEVVKIGGVPIALQNNSDLIEFYAPILKADFKTIENYNYIENMRLDFPIDVFYGTEEEITDEEKLLWEKESTKDTIINMLEGDHFFIYNHETFFINYFKSLSKNSDLLFNYV